MTPEERFERIERNLEALTVSQQETDKRLQSFIATAEASMKHNEQMTATLTEATAHMDRVLTEFLKALTTQRTNGKTT